MNGFNRLVGKLLVDQNGNGDFACGNHADVDAGFIKSTEHLRSRARMRLHTGTDDGYFCDRCVAGDLFPLEAEQILKNFNGGFGIFLGTGEGDILCTVSSDRLKNNVDIDSF